MLLHADRLCKRYRVKGTLRTAVEDVSLTVDSGQIRAFLGPNGAGKTTTIKMIAGLVRPDAGTALVAGHDVEREPSQAKRAVGAVLEGSRNLYWRLTALENVQYWGGIKGVPKSVAKARGLDLLREFGLASKLADTVQKLSRGQQQQVAICAALVHEPQLLLLDEPTLGLDVAASDRIQSLIRRLAVERRIGIVLTTHQMDVAESLAHVVSIIDNGRILLEGSMAQLTQQFNQRAYRIELGAALSVAQQNNVARCGATVVSDRLLSLPIRSDVDLYAVVRALEPLPIVRLEQTEADLASVFRRSVYGNTQTVEGDQ